MAAAALEMGRTAVGSQACGVRGPLFWLVGSISFQDRLPDNTMVSGVGETGSPICGDTGPRNAPSW